MSHTVDKKKEPEQEVSAPQAQQQEAAKLPPLSSDPATLVDEWRKAQGFVAQANLKLREQQQIIETAQQTIEGLKNQGLQVVGRANVILQILAGMGIDPNKYGFPKETQSDDFSLQGSLPPAQEKSEVTESKPVSSNPRVAALRKRFSR